VTRAVARPSKLLVDTLGVVEPIDSDDESGVDRALSCRHTSARHVLTSAILGPPIGPFNRDRIDTDGGSSGSVSDDPLLTVDFFFTVE
jgi:hypothetical protein